MYILFAVAFKKFLFYIGRICDSENKIFTQQLIGDKKILY